MASTGIPRTEALIPGAYQRETLTYRQSGATLRRSKSAIGAAWILGAGVIGVTADVTSVGGAVLLAGFGLVPPLVMLVLLTLWSDGPSPTVAELLYAVEVDR